MSKLDGSRSTVLGPYSVILREEDSSREDLLWDFRTQATPKEVASRLCTQHRLPLTEENVKYIEHQIQRSLRIFKDANVGAPMVSIVMKVPLGGDYVLVDKLMWDLNNPRSSVDLYVAALCRDFGLGWPQFASIGKVLKARIEACRQELRSGGDKVTLAPAPPTAKRKTPSNFPIIVKLRSTRSITDEAEIGPPKAEGDVAVSPTSTRIVAARNASVEGNSAKPEPDAAAVHLTAPQLVAPGGDPGLKGGAAATAHDLAPAGPAKHVDTGVHLGQSAQQPDQLPQIVGSGADQNKGGPAQDARGELVSGDEDSDMPDLGLEDY